LIRHLIPQRKLHQSHRRDAPRAQSSFSLAQRARQSDYRVGSEHRKPTAKRQRKCGGKEEDGKMIRVLFTTAMCAVSMFFWAHVFSGIMHALTGTLLKVIVGGH
jgi:hypothetical protein